MSEAAAGPREKAPQVAWGSGSDHPNRGTASWNFLLLRSVTQLKRKKKRATSNTAANEIGEGLLSKARGTLTGLSELIHGTGAQGHGVEPQRGSKKRQKWPKKSAWSPSGNQNARWSSRSCTGTGRFETSRRKGYGMLSFSGWDSFVFLAFSAWKLLLPGVLLPTQLLVWQESEWRAIGGGDLCCVTKLRGW